MARAGSFSGTSTSPFAAITQSLDELYRVMGNSSNPANAPTVPGPPPRDPPPTSGLPVVTPPHVTPPQIDLSRPAPWVGNLIENFTNPPWADAITNAISLMLPEGWNHRADQVRPRSPAQLAQLGEQVRRGLGSFEGFRKLWP